MAITEPAPGTVPPAPVDPGEEPLEQPTPRDRAEDELVESELLVEDVSIDGMCGVY
jgi:mycofactocin precursor